MPTKCFNGHVTDRQGCVGCHHAFHVIEPGKVVDGELVSPVVEGPESCELCHTARHAAPVDGCPRCDAEFGVVLESAMKAAGPIREEIWSLHALGWFIGWPPRVAGWLGIAVGGFAGDWFERPDGGQNWVAALASLVSIPLMQWAIRRAISQKERRLPRLSRRGRIVYGDEEK